MGSTFYAKGLRFECTRCSRCCRHTPGYVFLSPKDADRLAGHLGVGRVEFVRTWCRPVNLGLADRVSLREKPNFDCVFWENGGCSVYEARPLQCRAYPFWEANVADQAAWDEQARQCPGIGQGPLHGRAQIEGWLEERRRDGFLER